MRLKCNLPFSFLIPKRTMCTRNRLALRANTFLESTRYNFPEYGNKPAVNRRHYKIQQHPFLVQLPHPDTLFLRHQMFHQSLPLFVLDSHRNLKVQRLNLEIFRASWSNVQQHVLLVLPGTDQ